MTHRCPGCPRYLLVFSRLETVGARSSSKFQLCPWCFHLFYPGYKFSFEQLISNKDDLLLPLLVDLVHDLLGVVHNGVIHDFIPYFKLSN